MSPINIMTMAKRLIEIKKSLNFKNSYKQKPI